MSARCNKHLLVDRRSTRLTILLVAVLVAFAACAAFGDEPEMVAISGYVRTASGLPVEDVTVWIPDCSDCLGVYSCLTDPVGRYELTVQLGWSGTVYASKGFCWFDPQARTYDNVTADLSEQNFTATLPITVSGHVRTPDGTPVQGVWIYANSQYQSDLMAITDADGYYSFSTLLPGWSGSLEARADDIPYSIDSPPRPHENVTEDLTDQDFTATPYVRVSGYFRMPDGAPSVGHVHAEGSYEYISDTDENGYYFVSVPVGWSGRIEAYTSMYYVLEPNYRDCEDVTADLTDQNFTTIPFKTIRGHVRQPGGQGVGQVQVSVSNGGFAGTTEAGGEYTAYVPPGWSGSISVERLHYAMEPPSRTYTDVTEDLAGEDYVADPYKSISGFVRTSDGQPLLAAWVSVGPGLDIGQVQYDGSYSFLVPPGWSGAIEATAWGYAMEPPKRIYENVIADVGDQDFTAVPLVWISGRIRTAEGEGAGPAFVRADNGGQEQYVYEGGYFSLGVPPGWSGTVSVESWLFQTEDNTKTFSDVVSDVAGQDFIAEPANRALSDIKKSPDGTFVTCPSFTTTAYFGDCFYAESTGREFGIRMLGDPMFGVGSAIWDTNGLAATDDNGERYIIPLFYGFFDYVMEPIKPFYLNNCSLGGGDCFYNAATGIGQQGIAGAIGLNNIGLLVTTSGRVTERSSGWFCIDDGSGVGVKCVMPNGVILDSGLDYVTVTGLSSCEKDESGDLHRVLRVRAQEDIR